MSSLTVPVPNYYDVLGVPPWASLTHIAHAYRRKLGANRLLMQFAHPVSERNKATTVISSILQAWAVLSDPVAKSAHDRTHNTTRANPDELLFEEDEDVCTPETNNTTDRPPSPASEKGKDCTDLAVCAEPTAQFRSVELKQDRKLQRTLIDVIFGDWRFDLLLSHKFLFAKLIDSVTPTEIDSDTVTMKLTIWRNPSSGERFGLTMNELTVRINSIANDYRVSRLSTIFTEKNGDEWAILELSLTKGISTTREAAVPWEFGFNFDLNRKVDDYNYRRGTCMMFSRAEPPLYMNIWTGPGSPEDALQMNKELTPDRNVSLDAERLMITEYGEVRMWCLAAVSYKSAPSRKTGL